MVIEEDDREQDPVTKRDNMNNSLKLSKVATEKKKKSGCCK